MAKYTLEDIMCGEKYNIESDVFMEVFRLVEQKTDAKMIREQLNMIYVKHALLTVRKMIEEGDQKAATVYEAMAYQVAKSIAEMTVPLKGKVDAIILTGGAAHSKKLTGMIQDYAGHLGEFVIMPGEKELEALAAGAYRIVTGKETVNEYDPL